jgi:hypothetical protein
MSILRRRQFTQEFLIPTSANLLAFCIPCHRSEVSRYSIRTIITFIPYSNWALFIHKNVCTLRVAVNIILGTVVKNHGRNP